MYCTVADLKTYLDITADVDDKMLMAFTSRATRMIDVFVGYSFEGGSTTRIFDAISDTDGRALIFDTWCCEISEVINGDGTEVTADQYITLPRNAKQWYGIKLLSSAGIGWAYDEDPEDAISITGCWSWSESAPDDVTQACLRLSAWLYRQKDTSADIDRPILAGDGNVLMPSTMPSDLQAILAPYRWLT